VNSRYDEAMPRAARYVVGHHISSYVEVRVHLDRLTYTDLIWMPYHSHRRVRPFESISLFRGLIRYGEKIQRYMPDRVLRQFGYEQRIPDTVLRYDGGVFEDIDYRWLHFADHLVTGLTAASHPHACSVDYMDWFMLISHPFINPLSEEDRPHVESQARPRSPADTDPQPPADEDHSPVSNLIKIYVIFCFG